MVIQISYQNLKAEIQCKQIVGEKKRTSPFQPSPFLQIYSLQKHNENQA